MLWQIVVEMMLLNTLGYESHVKAIHKLDPMASDKACQLSGR